MDGRMHPVRFTGDSSLAMKKPCDWSREDVARWLADQGLPPQYRDSLAHLDGRGLLNLAAAPPLSDSLAAPNGGQQQLLLERIAALRIHPSANGTANHGLNGMSNGVVANNGLGNSNSTTKTEAANGGTVVGGVDKEWSVKHGGLHGGGTPNGFAVHHHHHHQGAPPPPPATTTTTTDRVQIRIIPPPLSSDPSSSGTTTTTARYSSASFPEEWGKTGATLLYALACFVCTSVMISVVHERVPPKEDTPPLPDKFFDWFDRRAWAFAVCEVIGMLLVGAWLVQWSLLKYRSIVGRRFFFLVGTLYLYRIVTMYITTLPVPGMHFHCSPKVSGDYVMMTARVMKMLCGGGLTITGSHHLCGDYLYSGHTVIITLTSLFVTEYSPRRLWWYQWLVWALCTVGLFCILLAHDHYSIDVVVAYYMTSRLFWWYHTMANLQVLKESSHSNFVSRVWWYRVFLYLERNVQGVVPRHYQLPLPCKRLLRGTTAKYSRLANSDYP